MLSHIFIGYNSQGQSLWVHAYEEDIGGQAVSPERIVVLTDDFTL